MENIKSILTLSLLLFLSSSAKATHVMGSDIFYKHISGMKYEITIKYYRDCRGVAFANPSAASRVICDNTSNNIPLSLSLKAINDVTPVCDTVSSPCNPANTFGTGDGIEEHVYVDTIDFASSPFDVLIGCSSDIIIRTSQCCRNSAITTGPENKNFFTEAIIRFQPQFEENSTPVFEVPPIFRTSVNQPFNYAIGAVDTVDYDSLSFSWGHPLSGHGQNIGFTGTNLAYNHPFTAYYPGGFSPPHNNPNANPPEGIYLDPKTGNITATPTSSAQVTVLVIEVNEWRRDSLGVYQIISVTRRDVQFAIVATPNNNVPVITFDSVGIQSTGAGCVSFTIKDDVFVPPPPSSAVNDTLDVRLAGSDPHLNMIIDSTVYSSSSTTVYGRVCYDSVWSTLGDNSIYLYARDNQCPWNAEASKGVNLDFPNRTSAGILNSNTKALHGVKMYPNPASNLVTIEVANGASNCTLELVDVTGKVLFAKDYKNLRTTTIDLKEFVSGAYLIRMTSSDGVAFKNLIVN